MSLKEIGAAIGVRPNYARQAIEAGLRQWAQSFAAAPEETLCELIERARAYNSRRAGRLPSEPLRDPRMKIVALTAAYPLDALELVAAAVAELIDEGIERQQRAFRERLGP